MKPLAEAPFLHILVSSSKLAPSGARLPGLRKCMFQVAFHHHFLFVCLWSSPGLGPEPTPLLGRRSAYARASLNTSADKKRTGTNTNAEHLYDGRKHKSEGTHTRLSGSRQCSEKYKGIENGSLRAKIGKYGAEAQACEARRMTEGTSGIHGNGNPRCLRGDGAHSSRGVAFRQGLR